MRAVVLREHGDIDKLSYEEDYPDPTAAEGQVVVRVRAASLNHHDIFTCRGMPGIALPLPVVIGLDMAGEIASVGPGVTGWAVGDRVLVDPLDHTDLTRGLMGEVLDGGAAEYCAVDRARLIRLPDHVPFDQAACIPIAYATAYRMLITNGVLESGQRVLILGAAGGVGSACVQIAKMVGAEVVACAGSDAKLEILKGWGADHLINYATTPEFEKKVWQLFGKPHRRRFDGGVDMVVNYTGGETWVRSLKCLRRGGRLVTCGNSAGFDPRTDIRYIWSYELRIQGSSNFSLDDLTATLGLVADGRLSPRIDRVLPLEETHEGIRLLRDREVVGKVVVAP